MKKKPAGASADVPSSPAPPPVPAPPAVVINTRPAAPAPDSFVLQIDETTTLGQLQIVIACLGVDMRWYFRSGRYHCKVFAAQANGGGSGKTLGQAVREAILELRARTAVAFEAEGVVR